MFAAMLAIVCCSQLDAQQRVRISGLEENGEYAALVEEQGKLSHMSDSISQAMERSRRSFRTDTLNRATHSAAILRMEEEMFDIRNRMARLAGHINSIEQEWVLEKLGEGEQPDSLPVNPSQSEPMYANLVYNTCFDRNLSPADVRDLRNAQAAETEIPRMIEEYRENNGRLRILKRAYDLSLMAGTADSIKTRFDSLDRVNATLDRRIALVWATVFDNKSYCYNLLLDKNNRNDMLLRYDDAMENMRRQQAELMGVFASDEIMTYALQKRLLTDYEIKLAEEFSNAPAADSLKRVLAALPKVDALDPEPVQLNERLFLDYSDITITQSQAYNAQNPIPEVNVYPKGVIYRVLLGTYSSPQSPAAFRSVAPLAVHKGPDGKLRYFAGGFPSDTTVNQAVEQMRKSGFNRPEAAIWMDGVYVNLATGKGFGSGFYRVELSGVHELRPEIRDVIRTLTDGKDIVRGDGTFIVGPLDNAAEAAKLRTTLEGMDAGMEIKISEIE